MRFLVIVCFGVMSLISFARAHSHFGSLNLKHHRHHHRAKKTFSKKTNVNERAINYAIAALGGYDAGHLAANDAVNLDELDAQAVQDVGDAGVVQVRADRSKLVVNEPVMNKTVNP